MTPPAPAPRTGHPFHMHDAIHAQPAALRLIGRGQGEAIAAAAAGLRHRERVVLAGVGSSWHAALASELLFARAGRLGHRVRALSAFDLAHAWPPCGPRDGVVVVSHRATNRATHQALARAREGGALTVAVTGKGVAHLPGADHLLHTVEPEVAEAHTVSYTGALALLARLAAATGDDEEVPAALDALPDQVALLLGHEPWEELAQRLAGRRRYFFVGGGPNAATALEAALKMSETNHLSATGMHCEEFLHGAWVAMEPGDLLVVIAPAGPSRDRCADAARAARTVGTPVLALATAGDRELAGLATEAIELPGIDELLSPLLAVVPLQLLCYHWAVLRGANPDVMRADQAPYARAQAALAR